MIVSSRGLAVAFLRKYPNCCPEHSWKTSVSSVCRHRRRAAEQRLLAQVTGLIALKIFVVGLHRVLGPPLRSLGARLPFIQDKPGCLDGWGGGRALTLRPPAERLRRRSAVRCHGSGSRLVTRFRNHAYCIWIYCDDLGAVTMRVTELRSMEREHDGVVMLSRMRLKYSTASACDRYPAGRHTHSWICYWPRKSADSCWTIIAPPREQSHVAPGAACDRISVVLDLQQAHCGPTGGRDARVGTQARSG